MKKILLKIIILTLVPLSSFASSYEERALAKCGDFTLVQVSIGSQESDGTVSNVLKYEVEVGNDRLFVDVTELSDLTTYQFVIDDIGHSITKAFEFVGPDGAMFYRYEGQSCLSL